MTGDGTEMEKEKKGENLPSVVDDTRLMLLEGVFELRPDEKTRRQQDIHEKVGKRNGGIVYRQNRSEGIKENKITNLAQSSNPLRKPTQGHLLPS